ncbi:GNAT family N-acetyltransferase [Cytobacillus kochii]|uniref:GNAT family N-acetyltransferase n=1 Tax=Cytobacillus kochii TaxID=859143 RepID=UPI001CD73971|nr:GNAT family protein [Cytobacillus kochii]MCA1024857.1 GNAT family N-acetyltransferase [Cytobacillus kochii]MCM3323660.1 GNAT family N-acetyltransferase [Cytobacillus kochii]MCM3346159.1 GNAT family N-acetyltransferase [Cytobacillus kochii]MDM5206549.1 GNAT family protein [Cytobacillus kochii]
MIIKELSVDDAKQLVQLMKDVEASSPYMLMEAGERTLTVEGAEAIINRDHITVIGAEDGERLIGYTLVIKETVRRKKHCASIVVGVHKDYRGMGVGGQLLQAVLAWANQEAIMRIELTVVSENEAALALYKKIGFEVEGVKRRSLLMDGEYYDEYYMGKLF